MAIDHEALRIELKGTIDKVREAMAELEEPVLERGFVIPAPAVSVVLNGNELNGQYASGKLFFDRVWNEVAKSTRQIEMLTEGLIRGDSIESQLAFDGASLCQRKLFETFCSIAMLSREGIYGDEPGPALYYLHYHLAQEIEYLRLRNADLTAYFGGECQTTRKLQITRENLKRHLTEVLGVEEGLCTWSKESRRNFENVLPDTSDLEKTAIGFGYQQVFGAASSQIHLNMCGMHEPKVNERAFLECVDNLLLLCVCVMLRAGLIVELAYGTASGGLQSLRDEFSGAFPNRYAAGALGMGDVGDIVVVFEAPSFFLGVIQEKRSGFGTAADAQARAEEAAIQAGLNAEAAALTAGAPPAGAARAGAGAEARTLSAAAVPEQPAEHVSYNIELMNHVGRGGCFTDIEVMVIVKQYQIDALIDEAIATGVIDREARENGDLHALQMIINNQEGVRRFIEPRMNAVNMPSLFFVQRYRERSAVVERGSMT